MMESLATKSDTRTFFVQIQSNSGSYFETFSKP